MYYKILLSNLMFYSIHSYLKEIQLLSETVFSKSIHPPLSNSLFCRLLKKESFMMLNFNLNLSQKKIQNSSLQAS